MRAPLARVMRTNLELVLAEHPLSIPNGRRVIANSAFRCDVGSPVHGILHEKKTVVFILRIFRL